MTYAFFKLEKEKKKDKSKREQKKKKIPSYQRLEISWNDLIIGR